MTIIETNRLLLREWKDSDKIPFATMNADPAVMEFMHGLMTTEESNAFADRIKQHFVDNGYGLYALELKQTKAFIGFTGLQNVRFDAAFTPAIEIGWRIASPYWNNGLATEAATSALAHAFSKLRLKEVVSFTAIQNKKSQRIMQKIGLQSDPKGNFLHPALDENHPLREHVLYRSKAAD